jgi:hypothetical protein
MNLTQEKSKENKLPLNNPKQSIINEMSVAKHISSISTNGGIDNRVIDKYTSGDLVRELDLAGKRNAFHLVEKAIGIVALKEFDINSRRMKKFNDSTAKTMILKNKDTEFGKKHSFEKILRSKDPIKEFKQNVPVSDYWAYEDSINRMAAGEKNILTKEDPTFFALSSGTTGKNKLIPVNKSSHAQALKGVMLINGTVSKIIPKADSSHLGINLMRMDDNIHKTSGGIPMGDASSGGLKKMSWMLPLLYTTPIEALTIADKPTANYIHALFGMKDKNLKHITSTFAPYVIQLMKNMEQRWPDLVHSLETGKLPSDLKITPEERRAIEKQIKPDLNRANELRKEFSKGFENIIPRIWPNFSYIGAVTTGSFDVYIPELKKYSGNTPIYNGTYGASEGWMAISNSIQRPKEFALLPGANYYEFIPVENMEDKNPKTVDIKDLKAGKEYEMVITTYSGFYRYRVGDVIKVNNFLHENPVIEFCYRRGTLLNLAGEKVTEKQTKDAMIGFSEKFLNKNDKIVDYTTVADTNTVPPRYKFFIELNSSKQLNNPEVKKNAIDILEHELGKTSYDYSDMRNHRMLSQMDIVFLKPGAFERLTESMRKAGDVKLSNQIKIPRVLKNPNLIKHLENERI